MSHDSTRRTFLGTGLTLASTSLMSAAENQSDKTRILVIGSGARGADLIRALATIDSATIVVSPMIIHHTWPRGWNTLASRQLVLLIIKQRWNNSNRKPW